MDDRPTEAASSLSAAARVLGFAGLLPQLIAVLFIATGLDGALGALLAFAYATIILSFIGGMWWGLAMRTETPQPRVVAWAIVPTLVAFALLVARVCETPAGWVLVLTGSVIMLTLLVDRMLVRDGLAPAGWMGLRVPLSMGLGGLTILAGALAPHAVSVVYSS